jgi:hypothetical protein
MFLGFYRLMLLGLILAGAANRFVLNRGKKIDSEKTEEVAANKAAHKTIMYATALWAIIATGMLVWLEAGFLNSLILCAVGLLVGAAYLEVGAFLMGIFKKNIKFIAMIAAIFLTFIISPTLLVALPIFAVSYIVLFQQKKNKA